MALLSKKETLHSLHLKSRVPGQSIRLRLWPNNKRCPDQSLHTHCSRDDFLRFPSLFTLVPSCPSLSFVLITFFRHWMGLGLTARAVLGVCRRPGWPWKPGTFTNPRLFVRGLDFALALREEQVADDLPAPFPVFFMASWYSLSASFGSFRCSSTVFLFFDCIRTWSFLNFLLGPRSLHQRYPPFSLPSNSARFFRVASFPFCAFSCVIRRGAGLLAPFELLFGSFSFRFTILVRLAMCSIFPFFGHPLLLALSHKDGLANLRSAGRDRNTFRPVPNVTHLCLRTMSLFALQIMAEFEVNDLGLAEFGRKLGRELEGRLSAVEQSASPGQRALCLRSAREFVNKVQARLGTIEGIDEVLERLAVGADPDSLPRAAHGSGQCNAGFAGDDDSGGDYGHCGDHSDVSATAAVTNAAISTPAVRATAATTVVVTTLVATTAAGATAAATAVAATTAVLRLRRLQQRLKRQRWVRQMPRRQRQLRLWRLRRRRGELTSTSANHWWMPWTGPRRERRRQ